MLFHVIGECSKTHPLDFFLQKIIASRDATSKSVVEDFECAEKIFEDFRNKKHALLQEISDNAEKLANSVKSTFAQLAEPATIKYLEYLKACSNAGQWLEKAVKPKQLAECKESLLGYVGLKYGGLATIKSINDKFLLSDSCNPPSGLPPTKTESTESGPFLVNVTCVKTPGEFYVVRASDEDKLKMITSTLNEAAFSYPTPSQCISSQIYAVCDDGGNWNRGRCVSRCGFMAFDGKEETLYEFFMLDQGQRENNIRSSTIRTLPSNIASYPPFARECTLNPNFQPVNWDVKTVNYFKQLTRRGPMEMKILSKEGDVFNVDLAQLPCFAEEENIVSVRNALLPPLSVCNVKSLKLVPKFHPGAPDPAKHYRVNVSNALTPTLIYVHILDEDFERYQNFKEELQKELGNAETDPDARVQNVHKGIGTFFLL